MSVCVRIDMNIYLHMDIHQLAIKKENTIKVSAWANALPPVE